MPRWKPRDPNIYPILFFDTVEVAAFSGEPTLLRQLQDEITTHKYMDRFREWRMCLRKQPSARCGDIELSSRITTKAVPDPLTGGFSVYVQVKPLLLASLERLNPRLWAEIERLQWQEA